MHRPFFAAVVTLALVSIPASAARVLLHCGRLIDGASEAAELASNVEAAEGDQTLAIAISCVGRRLVLGQRAEEEICDRQEVARPDLLGMRV